MKTCFASEMLFRLEENHSMAKMFVVTNQLTQIITFALFLLRITRTAAQLQSFHTLIVPEIQQENYQLTSNGTHYHLHLVLPDGSERDELGELKNANTADEELSIVGTLKVYYPDIGATGITTYTANRDGYVTKYKLQSGKVVDDVARTMTTAAATTTDDLPLVPENRASDIIFSKRKEKPPPNANAIPLMIKTLKTVTSRVGKFPKPEVA